VTSRQAGNYWGRLGPQAQFALALALAQRRQHAFKAMFRNVLSVGAGYRAVGSQPALKAEFCLRFLVKRKWRDARCRADEIPKAIPAYWRTRGGQKRRVMVPTDVSEFGGSPHRMLDLTDGIESWDGAQAVEYGSACCLVRNADVHTQRYVLSCYHVLVPEMVFPPPSNRLRATGMTGTAIGPYFSAADPSGRSAADAAIVAVDDATVQRLSLWGRMAVRYASWSEFNAMPHGGPYMLYPRRQVPPGVAGAERESAIGVSFHSLFPRPMEYDYSDTAGRSFVFPATVEYLGSVRAGDSGAPLMDSRGVLYGMHFYGNGNKGYAQAAATLFESACFTVDIEI
jgi:hypothetical protein